MNKDFNFENLDLEFYNIEKQSWCKGHLIGIVNANSYNLQSSSKNYTVDTGNIRAISKIFPIDDITTKCEYEIEPGYYMPCLIQNRVGKFYSIELHENLTRISREKGLRNATFLSMENIIQSHFDNLTFDIPSELKDWIESEGYKEMLKSIEEDGEAVAVPPKITFYSTLYPSESKPVTHLRIFCLKDQSETISLVIETAIENEMKLLRYIRDKSSQLMKLKTVQKELGKIKKFYIDKDLVGILIGSKGYNVNRLKNTYKVSIGINSDIPGEKAQVTITGDDDTMVDQCYHEMNICMRTFEIREKCEDKLRKYSQSYISNYQLNKFVISRSKYKDENGNAYYIHYLDIIGSEESVNNLVKEIQNYLKG